MTAKAHLGTLGLLFLAITAAPSTAFAFPSFAGLVPNGTASWGGPGAGGGTNYCMTCHNNPNGGSGCQNLTATPPRNALPWTMWQLCIDRGCDAAGNTGQAPCLNAFGQAFQAARNQGIIDGTLPTTWWGTIAAADADGDLASNGTELGDPAGTWVMGMPQPPLISHPGDGGTPATAVDICCIGGPVNHDFDECSAATPYEQCDQGTCVNVVARGPSYTCTCNSGWEGTLCDTDILECTLTPTICGANGTCNELPGSFSCTCATGYSGTLCDVDIDECAAGTAGCDANATCTNAPAGSFTCTCNAGWEGDGTTCTDINDCTGGSCGTNEVCVNEVGAPFSCECVPGFTGTPCEENCGDGVLGPSESCEDGNATAGDGCGATCVQEAGWNCTGSVGGLSSCTRLGVDAGTPDAGIVYPDAGMPDGGPIVMDEDCSCRTASSRRSSPLWLLLAPLGLALLLRRRARRR